MINKLKYGAIGYGAGFISAAILAVIFRGCLVPEAPVQKSSSVHKREVTIKSEYKPGKPDTAEAVISRQSSVISKKGDKEFTAGKDSSVVKKSFDYENADLDLTITTYPGVDSVHASTSLSMTEKTITRVDTLYQEKIISDSVIVENVITVKSFTSWNLKLGVSPSLKKSEFRVFKHLQLSYNFPVWFFYLTAEAGFQNEFSNGLKDLELITKAEINIPLN